MHFLMFTGFRFYSGNFYHIHYPYQISLWGEFFEGDWGVVSCSNESHFGHIDGILLQMSLVKTLGSVLHQQSPLFLKPFPLLEPSFGQQSPLTQPFPLTSPYAVPRNPHLSGATSARPFPCPLFSKCCCSVGVLWSQNGGYLREFPALPWSPGVPLLSVIHCIYQKYILTSAEPLSSFQNTFCDL